MGMSGMPMPGMGGGMGMGGGLMGGAPGPMGGMAGEDVQGLNGQLMPP